MDVDGIKLDAIGKWPGIFMSLGIKIPENGNHGPCPICQTGKDRFRLTNETGNGEWFCNQCIPHAGDGWSLLQKVLGVDFKTAIEEVSKIIGTVNPTDYQKETTVSPEILRQMFLCSKPVVKGDEVNRYLYYRGLTSMPSVLRYSEKCWEPETRTEHHAMLAIFHSAEGEAITIHRTYLSEHAGKLKIKSPRKIMPPLKKMTGGACRLYKWEEGPLGIAEGIETSIAVHNYTKIPCWAALTAVLLESWIPPKTAKEIHIYGDNDVTYTGQKAAYILANRLALQSDIKVTVFIPDQPGTDWLDVWGWLENKELKEA